MEKNSFNSIKKKLKETSEKLTELTSEIKGFAKENINNDKVAEGLQKTESFAKQVVETVSDKAKKIDKEKISNRLSTAKETTKKQAIKVKDKAVSVAQATKNKTIELLDENGDGVVDVEDIIIISMKVPGVRINREEFLRKEFFKNYDNETINLAIAKNPMEAGIDSKEIDRIADNVIEYERNLVSGISTALGMPGGFAMAATIPADIAQYYGYMLRTAQKLLYLYGFPQIETNNNSYLDSETINILTICLGVMYGVAGANNALKAMAKALATGVERKLIRAALTKGTFYPIVKKVASWFGTRMTKQVLAGFFKKAIPVVGGVVGGGLTYASFKPCCVKLRDSLKDTRLSNKNHKESEEDNKLDIIDVVGQIKNSES